MAGQENDASKGNAEQTNSSAGKRKVVQEEGNFPSKRKAVGATSSGKGVEEKVNESSKQKAVDTNHSQNGKAVQDEGNATSKRMAVETSSSEKDVKVEGNASNNGNAVDIQSSINGKAAERNDHHLGKGKACEVGNALQAAADAFDNRIVIEYNEYNVLFPMAIQSESIFRRLYLGSVKKFKNYCSRLVDSVEKAQQILQKGRLVDNIIVLGGDDNMVAHVQNMFLSMGTKVEACIDRMFVVRTPEAISKKLYVGWRKHFVISAEVTDSERQAMLTVLKDNGRAKYTIGCWALSRFHPKPKAPGV